MPQLPEKMEVDSSPSDVLFTVMCDMRTEYLIPTVGVDEFGTPVLLFMAPRDSA